MIQELMRVAELQRRFSPNLNDPAMKERRHIVEKLLPERMSNYSSKFRLSLGRFGEDLLIEGSNGKGKNAEAPWVRLSSARLSPKATKGFFVVIHFAVNGEKCFVAVQFGSSQWLGGVPTAYSDERLEKESAWARSALVKAGEDVTAFTDKLKIGSKQRLPRSYERATVVAKAFNPIQMTVEEFSLTVNAALKALCVIYAAQEQEKNLSALESASMDLELIVNPARDISGSRQTWGLTGPERRAVELYAMKKTRDYLKKLGYKVKDTSSSKPFDFLAKRDGEEVVVEVKGTTSAEVDSILMTANEVEFHKMSPGKAALAIVSDICLLTRGDSPQCEGGILEYIEPWDIRQWEQKPIAFEIIRVNSKR